MAQREPVSTPRQQTEEKQSVWRGGACLESQPSENRSRSVRSSRPTSAENKAFLGCVRSCLSQVKGKLKCRVSGLTPVSESELCLTKNHCWFLQWGHRGPG